MKITIFLIMKIEIVENTVKTRKNYAFNVLVARLQLQNRLC